MVSFSINDQTIFKDVEIVGTYNKTAQHFTWAWANDDVDSDLHEVADAVKAYGMTHQLAYFTEPVIACSENEVWSLVAFACELGEAEGAYCGNMEGQDILVYMIFKDEADDNDPSE